jgi:6-phosphofructokinase
MCEENDVLCNVIGVPKSIDNDILLIDKCFGFDTAVEEAQRALLAAKVGSSRRHMLAYVICAVMVTDSSSVAADSGAIGAVNCSELADDGVRVAQALYHIPPAQLPALW